MLAVRYFGSEGEPVGGYTQCSECGPLSMVELRMPDAEVRRRLLEERKAS